MQRRPAGAVAAFARALLLLTWATSVGAEEGEEQRFRAGGLLFGDVYHLPSHHSDEGEDATGAVLRRGYLTFDADFTRSLDARLRFEVNQAGEFETYTFEADFKDLFLGWQTGRHRLVFGLSPTPTFDRIESIWGLRYLARTPLDLQGVASRDTGVSASGPLGGSGTLRYRAMAGTGLEFGKGTGDGHKWMSALEWRPAQPWTVDAYFDYEMLSGRTDRTTLQAFVGYQTETLRWGVQYAHQDRQDDPTLELASAFVVRPLGQRASLVVRVDRLVEPSPRGDDIAYLPFDPTARATFFVGAVEFRLTPHLVVTPNTVVIAYDRNDEGVRPRTDIHLRLTLFLDLE